MNAAIQEVSIARVGVSQIDVGRLSVGPLSVGSLVLETAHVDVSTGAAQFRNLRVTISLRITID